MTQGADGGDGVWQVLSGGPNDCGGDCDCGVLVVLWQVVMVNLWWSVVGGNGGDGGVTSSSPGQEEAEEEMERKKKRKRKRLRYVTTWWWWRGKGDGYDGDDKKKLKSAEQIRKFQCTINNN